MRICQITHGRVNPDGENGITRTVYNLNKHLNLSGIHSEIYSFNDNQVEIEDFIRDEHTTVKLFPRENFIKKNKFVEFINSSDFNFDIVHFHLMWMIDKNTILKALKNNRIPYVITIHGAYAPNLIDSIKKKISMKTLELSYLKGASSLHALCFEEKYYLRNLNLTNPIFVIPNGVSDSEISKIANSKELPNPYHQDFFNILWVGRIREDKNVLGIIKSLLCLPDKVRDKIKIHIVGNGMEDLIANINTFINDNKLKKSVIMHGPKYKDEKYQYIVNCDLYLQPSFSEGISFSILDAMACAVPLILSRQTNMTHYYNQNFYLMTETYPDDIANAILKVFSNKEYGSELASNALKTVENSFTWINLIHDYSNMYAKTISDNELN